MHSMDRAGRRVSKSVINGPGMDEKCRLAITLSRQTIVLFCRLIEAGLLSENPGFREDILPALSRESREELKAVHGEMLKRGDRKENQ